METMAPVIAALGGMGVVAAGVIGLLLFFAPLLIWMNVRQTNIEAQKQTVILRQIAASVGSGSAGGIQFHEEPSLLHKMWHGAHGSSKVKKCPSCGMSNGGNSMQCDCGHNWGAGW